MAEAEVFDFDEALKGTLDRIDVGPHCSCADITMELLRTHLPLRWSASRYAAAAFGGGVGGSGGPCGAFCAGLVALSLFAAKDEPIGCTTEMVEEQAAAYYDAWMARHGSCLCADLTGYPSLRDESVREEFFNSGGVDRCTQERIRFAVEKALEIASAS